MKFSCGGGSGGGGGVSIVATASLNPLILSCLWTFLGAYKVFWMYTKGFYTVSWPREYSTMIERKEDSKYYQQECLKFPNGAELSTLRYSFPG